MIPEAKLLEKVRKVLIGNATIRSYVKTRVYGSHPTTLPDIKWPAVTLHILSANSQFAERGYSDISLQIDIWYHDIGPQTFQDIMTISSKIHELLDRQDLTDSVIPITVGQMTEVSSGPMMSDPEPRLIHYPMVYRAVVT